MHKRDNVMQFFLVRTDEFTEPPLNDNHDRFMIHTCGSNDQQKVH
jgi:hypothetical protein